MRTLGVVDAADAMEARADELVAAEVRDTGKPIAATGEYVPGITVTRMPHGGTKHSGYGCDLSVQGLFDYTRVKHVTSAL